MKKFLFLMIFIVGLFSCSFAATFTFEEGKYQVYCKDYDSNESSYLADLGNINNLISNYSSPALPDLVISDEILEQYPYITFYYFPAHSKWKYNFRFSDKPLFARSYNLSTGYVLNGGYMILSHSDYTTNTAFAYSDGGSWTWVGPSSSLNNSFAQGTSSQPVPIYYANYDVYNRWNDSLVYSPDFYEDKVELPEMDNPFTNEELIDIYNRLNNSSVLKDYLPSNYNSYFITYNKDTGQYKAFFYPDTYMPFGRVYPENYEYHGGVSYDSLTYLLDIGFEADYKLGDYESFYNLDKSIPIYTFVTFGEDNEFWYHDTLTSDSISENIYKYDVSPIIFTTKEFHFYFLDEDGNIAVDDNGKIVDDKTLIMSNTILKDESGGDLSTDVDIADKDDESIWTAIINIPNKILEGIKSIFVPSEDFLSAKANEIIYKFSFYTSLQDTYQQFVDAITVDSNGAPIVAVDFSLSEDSVLADCGSANVLDFSWYEPFKPVVDLFIIAFVYGVFIYRFIVELPNIIAGISQGFEYVPLSKDSAYSGSGKIGFKTPGGDKK